MGTGRGLGNEYRAKGWGGGGVSGVLKSGITQSVNCKRSNYP